MFGRVPSELQRRGTNLSCWARDQACPYVGQMKRRFESSKPLMPPLVPHQTEVLSLAKSAGASARQLASMPIVASLFGGALHGVTIASVSEREVFGFMIRFPVRPDSGALTGRRSVGTCPSAADPEIFGEVLPALTLGEPSGDPLPNQKIAILSTPTSLALSGSSHGVK